ncbi:MAG: metallophosphoesterase family protein [Paludibacteraceae bacterium]|nr:metallophosphoesterase family protein [Paludibacteraceae bacterium]
MTRIGVLSDTHGLLDPRIFEHFKDMDEVWHAGDIGSLDVLLKLREFKPLRAVRGNADFGDVQYLLRDVEAFRVENVDVLLTHIGYRSGMLMPNIQRIVNSHPKSEVAGSQDTPTRLFVCGHSHILKVQYDHIHQMLCMNPGAAGKYGIHTVQTLLRFAIDGSQISDLEVIELQKK